MSTINDRSEASSKGLIALRQSGGVRFSTREVLVYRDGRVRFRQQGKVEAGSGTRHLTSNEMSRLKELIEQSGLRELPQSIGQPIPDGYAYELIVRLGRKSKAIEFFEGSVPRSMQALLSFLKELMRPTED